MNRQDLKNKFIVITICIVLVIANVNVTSVAAPTTPIEPEDNQYLELRAVDVKKVEGKNQQVTMELWGNNLKFKGFNVVFSYDKTKVNLSSLTTNEIMTDMSNSSNSYFQFAPDLAGALNFLQISEEAGMMDITITFNTPVPDNVHIIEDPGGKRKTNRYRAKLINRNNEFPNDRRKV